MIIDCHRHVWPKPKHLLDGSLGGAAPLAHWLEKDWPSLTDQNEARIRGLVDCSIILGFKSKLLKAEIPNDFVKQYVAQYADCTVGFAGVDPTERSTPVEAAELIRKQGFAGVVICPAAQGFHPCDTRAMNLYEKLVELDAPVMIHYPLRWLGPAQLEQARPILLDEVARTFGGLKMIISGLGWPWVDETLLLLAKHINVYAELSIAVEQPLRVYQVISNAYQYGIMDKLLFGSGWPDCTVRAAMKTLYDINEIPRRSGLPAVPREVLREILERDSLSLLGIKYPPMMASRHTKEKYEEFVPVKTTEISPS